MSVGVALTSEAPTRDPRPRAAIETAPVETRVLGRWARPVGARSDVRCVGADGTCSGWSGRMEDPPELAHWRVLSSHGNTLIVEISEPWEPGSDLVALHEVTVVVERDELRQHAAVFERVQDRVETCRAE